MKKEGYNRNLMGGKRPHRGTGAHPEYQTMTLAERAEAESMALDAYHKRVGQGRYSGTKPRKPRRKAH